jgi:hypothetical protein
MDPATNPFTPSAGARPPELVGRDPILAKADLLLTRTTAGRSQPSLVLTGLRGVGKTVLLRAIEAQAVERGALAIRVETTEEGNLPELLALNIRPVLLELDRVAALKEAARKALGVLRSFVRIRFQVAGLEAGINADPIPGLGDSGNLDLDLTALFSAVGAAAKERGVAVALFVDELQYARKSELQALVVAMHRMQQDAEPLALVSAGLPSLRGALGKAKSYTERLFEYPDVGSLDEADAGRAVRDPLTKEGVGIEPAALHEIFDLTKGYPYFLQTWGSFAWNLSPKSPITLEDVRRSTERAKTHLDANFFGVRYDRVTPGERKYLRAMASLGPGPFKTRSVATVLRTTQASLGPVREKLIAKGMAYDPEHGKIAFTVPMFDEFMKRKMPSSDPATW